MSVTQKLVTTNFNVESAASFVDSFANNDYFIFAGKHVPYPGSDAILTTPDNSLKSTNLDVYDDMIFSKRVTSTDVVHTISKYLWTANTFFDKYDHTDGNLYNKKFYTVVDDSTEYNVYKCLFNASNSSVTVNSTVAPFGKNTTADSVGDNYIWKYMYSISKTQYEKFATTNYIPVIANTDVQAAAVPGAIEVIDIIEGGRGYDNYIDDGIFKTTDLSVGGDNTIYGAPDTAVAEDDYYRGCVIKITNSSVPSAVNQYRRIIDYRGVGGQKTFTLNAPFSPAPTVSDTYEVYPYVYVWGDGTETVPAEGRAIIDDTASNSIIQIEMLNIGENYRYGESYPGETPNIIPVSTDSIFIELPATVSGAASFREAVLQPIISPPGGHGSNPITEFGAKRICISTKFTNSEGGTIPTTNDFRQVGLIKNPLYTNVVLTLKTANTIGSFEIGETVHQFKQFKLHGNVSITASNNVITKTDQGRISLTVAIANGGTNYSSDATVFSNNSGTGGSGFAASVTRTANVITAVTVTNQGNNYVSLPILQVNATSGSAAQLIPAFANPQTPTFKDSFSVGDYVLVTKGSNNFLSTVTSVPFDYQITTASNSLFTATDCDISALVLQASGEVTSIAAGQITLSNVAGIFTESSRVIGLTSNATSIIETSGIQVNGKAALGFNTPTQLTRLKGHFPAGGASFINDETVEQTSLVSYAKPTGAFHSIELGAGDDDDSIYISNKFSTFNLDPDGLKPITGLTSGAVLEKLNNKYPGDFVVGSGQVLYLENLDAITRAGNKSEIIKIILEF
jgi:hypothetical protein